MSPSECRVSATPHPTRCAGHLLPQGEKDQEHEMTHTIFIDGEAGDAGLEIRDRREGRGDQELMLLVDRRCDVETRREALIIADAVILCLSDDADCEAVSMIENPSVRVIDASTDYRVADGWTYGF